VDAALIVARQVPDFLLVLIGEADEPSDVGWIQRYVADRRAGSCVLATGRMPFRQALGHARHAFVGLSPVPRNELYDMGSPTKLGEYMALGLPAVCNDQPDQATVIVESGGGLCVDMTAEGFANGILAMLAEPARARAMGLAGRRYIEQHRSYRVLGEAVAEALGEMVAARARGVHATT
jgi:glycosyltransferase involved in cell wall biosynthesis